MKERHTCRPVLLLAGLLLTGLLGACSQNPVAHDPALERGTALPPPGLPQPSLATLPADPAAVR
jgi:hypothetical protein